MVEGELDKDETDEIKCICYHVLVVICYVACSYVLTTETDGFYHYQHQVNNLASGCRIERSRV